VPRSLHVNFLGGLQLEYQGESPSSAKLLVNPPTAKSQSLMAYLIIHRNRPQPRLRLIGMFWGDRPEKKARRSLSTALWHIRRCFEDQDPIQSSTQTVQFVFDGNLILDIDQFEVKVSRKDFLELQQAVDYYQGSFLDGFYDDWIINERYRLESLYIKALANLMDIHETAGDYSDALQVAQELLKFDSLHENAHRLLMRVYCALGQRNAALQQYQLCQKILRTELDVDPLPETSKLFQEIQSGNYKIGPAPSTKLAKQPRKFSKNIRSPLDVTARKILVGREKELALLKEQLSGQFNLILVSGEAGVGKTSLLEKYAENLSSQGSHVLWGRCHEFEHLLPYQPITEALRPNLLMATEEQFSRLPEWVGVEIKRLIPDLMTSQPGIETRPSTSTDQNQMRLFAAIAHYLSELSGSKRLLLVVEDLQWASASTLELLHYLVRNSPQSNIPPLIVGSYRPESLEGQNPLTLFQSQLQNDGLALPVPLSPLSSENVDQFLSEISGVEKMIIPLARRLYQETEGNPFFLVETIKALFEMDAITLKSDAWQGDFNLISQEELPLPASVSEVIQARVHRLEEITQDALRTAAVLGREFDFELLTETWSKTEDITLDALDEMLRHRLIDEGTGGSDRDYVFNHHKIQEVVYSAIPRQRRQHIHAKVGMALEKQYFSQLDEVVSVLAHHYLQAQYLDDSLVGKAVEYLHRAGNLAAKQFAIEDAVAYFNRALTLIPDNEQDRRCALLFARERIYDVQGNRPAQNDDLDALWDLAKLMTAELQAEVMLRKARFGREIGNYQAAIEAAQTAIKLAKADQKLLVSEGNMIWGQALNRQGYSKAAQSKYRKGLEMARITGARWLEAYCLNGLGLTYQYLGEPDQARRHQEEASQIFRQVDDLRGLSAALNNLGVIENEQGNNTAAKSFYLDALDIHKRMGYRKGEGMVLGNLGVIASAQGQYMQAIQDFHNSITVSGETGNQLSEGNGRLNLGNVYLHLGAYPEAGDSYQTALEIYREIGNRTGQGWGLAYSSMHAHRLGNHKLSLSLGHEALQIAEEIGDRHIQGYAWTHLGHTHFELEQYNDADEAYQKAVTLRREMGEMHLAMESLSGVLRVYLNQNNLKKAVPYLEEILSFLKDSNLEGTDEPLRIYHTCFRVLDACGDPRTKSILEAAHSMLQKQASLIDDDGLRDTFLQKIPTHREIVLQSAEMNI